MLARVIVWAGLALAGLAQETCPWCGDDPALLAAAGLVGHGPMDVGPPRDDGVPGSVGLAQDISAAQWIFLESAHLRFASSLGEQKVTAKDKARVEAELERLRAVFPSVPKKVRKLDPWLRLHLMVMKAEELYLRFQVLLDVTDKDFPESRTAEGPFMGDGVYLGEKEKYEVIIPPSRRAHQQFTTAMCGVSITDSLRWHLNPPHKLLVSIPAEDADLKRDTTLFPHIAHNLSHLWLCGYKHFSYDPPVWLDEGLAHLIEKEVNPESTTIDGDEGAMREVRGPSDWPEHAAKLARGGKAATFATLMHAKTFSELDMDAKVVAWSRLRFLADEHPAGLAAFIGGVKGQLDSAGYPTNNDLPGLQRELLRQHLGWTPAEFDTAWTAWATAEH